MICLCVLATLSLLPADEMVRTHAPKVVEHFVAYSGTGVFAALGFGRAGWPAARIIAALIVLAGALEYAQRFARGRESGWDTFFASGVGAIAGVLCLAVAVRLIAGGSQGAAALSR